MLLITCPWCGDRDEPEFSYGGQAHVPYPEDPEALDDAEWARYLFFRDNPAGPYAERWVHAAGCRRWFNAVRDTRTNEFTACYPAGSPRPDTSSAPGGAVSGGGAPSAGGRGGDVGRRGDVGRGDVGRDGDVGRGGGPAGHPGAGDGRGGRRPGPRGGAS